MLLLLSLSLSPCYFRWNLLNASLLVPVHCCLVGSNDLYRSVNWEKWEHVLEKRIHTFCILSHAHGSQHFSPMHTKLHYLFTYISRMYISGMVTRSSYPSSLSIFFIPCRWKIMLAAIFLNRSTAIFLQFPTRFLSNRYVFPKRFLFPGGRHPISMERYGAKRHRWIAHRSKSRTFKTAMHVGLFFFVVVDK